MNNQERREALTTAREFAVEHSMRAENNVQDAVEHADLACMWAQVAQALKTGDAAADS